MCFICSSISLNVFNENAFQGRCKKRVKMKNSSPSKELLIEWLRTALDQALYRGLGWLNEEKGIFYVKWVHKSSEQWSDEDLEPFKAWAGHKGKLDGKNPKQLKATFRCALNSKKELQEQGRDRERRYWQFVDPNTAEKDKAPKKRRKNNKVSRSCLDSPATVACKEDVKSIINNELFPPRISSKSEVKISRPTKLPPYDSFSNFQPLTPPDQANENPYTCTDFKFSKEEMDKLGKYGADHVPASFSSVDANNSLLENTYEASSVLPPFETFGSFRILTPPPQKNEVNFIPTEYRTNYTPPPDHSRLTPPQKPYHISQDSCNQSSTDVWQPNCWPVHHADKDPRGLSDFFSSDFIGIYKTSSQDTENSASMDFLDMDQYVPVMNTNNNVQIHNRNVQPTLVNRTPSCTPMETDNLLEKLDDFFLGDDVDPEACRRLMQEIDRTSSVPHYRILS